MVGVHQAYCVSAPVTSLLRDMSNLKLLQAITLILEGLGLPQTSSNSILHP